MRYRIGRYEIYSQTRHSQRGLRAPVPWTLNPRTLNREPRTLNPRSQIAHDLDNLSRIPEGRC
jgi:hypothetical protein